MKQSAVPVSPSRLNFILCAALIALNCVAGNLAAWGADSPSPVCDSASAARFEIYFPASTHAQPVTGRVYLMISKTNQPEVRLQSYWFNSPEFLGIDVHELHPDQIVIVDEHTLGYPFARFKDLPTGDYYVQASLIPYQRYPRADGHTVWALDQWNGQRFAASPGTLHSRVQAITLDGAHPCVLHLALTDSVPPPADPPDTPWVKHVKMQSPMLTKFWGRPIYLGAVVLLPEGYESGGKLRYPVIYQQQSHFSAAPPFDFATEETPAVQDRYRRECRGTCESGYEFAQAWQSDHFPKVIAVALQHPTPYADYSAAINSANDGPYGDAIVQELIPYLEQRFRIDAKPSARVLVGKSVGGRDALAQQLKYPDFYAGAWIFYPWGIDFGAYGTLNVYDRRNAFEIAQPEDPSWYGFWSGPEWSPLERTAGRFVDGQPFVTLRQLSVHDAVINPRTGGEFGAEDAIFGPVAPDGLPKPLWNRITGEIDAEVAAYWRTHGDLAEYSRHQWSVIGPKLIGKLHFYVGDSDEYYRAGAVHRLEEFLTRATPAYGASFEYASQKGHGWQPMSNADLVRTLSEQMRPAQHSATPAPILERANDSGSAMIPPPGDFAVGFQLADESDAARPFLTVDDHGRLNRRGARPLQILTWYPASATADPPMSVGDYIDTSRGELGHRDAHEPASLEEWRSATKANLGERLLAHRNALPKKGRFPVLIYAPSLSRPAWENADLCEYLATFGFIVVATSSKGESARPMTIDSAGAQAQTKDLLYLLDYASKLSNADSSRVAIVGFSWGGLANAIAALRDQRIKALVSLDGSIRYFPKLARDAGVDPDHMAIPMLYFAQDMTLEQQETFFPRDQFETPSLLNAWKSADRYMVYMHALTHSDFSSMQQRNSDVDWANQNYFSKQGFSTDDRRASIRYVAALTRIFLSDYLQQDPLAAAALKALSAPNQHEVLASIDARVSGNLVMTDVGSPTVKTGLPSLPRVPVKRNTETTLVSSMTQSEVLAWAEGLMDVRRYEQAAAVASAGADQYHDSASILAILGDAYSGLRLFAEARKAYQASRQIAPIDGLVLRKLKALDAATTDSKGGTRP